jgi:hypothetical protein
MKTQLTAIALAIMASSVWAQTARTTLPVLDRSTLRAVSSPNRMPSSTLTAQHREDSDGDRTSTDALILVDSTGKTVGRYVSASGYSAVLLPYKRDLMAIPLSADFDAKGNIISGGLTWANTNFGYSTPDCTGTPYYGITPFGTRYIGFPVKDAGQYYAYVGDTTRLVSVDVHSSYDFLTSTCYKTDFGILSLMPLSVVLPLSSIGTPLFYLK